VPLQKPKKSPHITHGLFKNAYHINKKLIAYC
jgi:hypothetical protein